MDSNTKTSRNPFKRFSLQSSHSRESGGQGPRLYAPLNRKKNEIRIATIKPSSDSSDPIHLTLQTASLSDRRLDYEALSYVWGDDKVTTQIFVNNFPFQATTNLDAALRAFRHHAAGGAVRIWIDAICINQLDKSEKGWQLTLMGKVYSQAPIVRAWLGPDELSGPGQTSSAFGLLRRFTSGPEMSIGPNSSALEVETVLKSVQQLATVFDNVYWRRRWITQEIVLARKLTLYCGNAFAPCVDLRLLCSRLEKLATELQVVLPYHGDREVFGVVNRDNEAWKAHKPCADILNAILPIVAFDKPLTKYPYHLRDIRGADQKKDQDCVYGILGLLERDLGHALIEPDYDLSIQEVFWDFAFKFMAASKSLAFMYEAYPEDRAIPTWAPDLRVTSRDNNRFVPDTVPISPADSDFNLTSAFQNMSTRTEIRFPNSASQRRTNTLAEFDHLFNASASSKFFVTLPATGLIHVRSFHVDTISDFSAHDRGLQDIAPQKAMDQWIPMDWTDMYDYAVRYGHVSSDDNIEDEALLRTLCADCMRPEGEPVRRLTFNDVRKHHQGIEIMQRHRGQVVEHPNTFLDAGMSLYRFFCTTGGRIGITYGDVQNGDMICVLASLNMPLIIRGAMYSTPEQLAAASSRTLLDKSYKGRSLETFTVVGSCYLHGIMDGEAIRTAAWDKQCKVDEVFEDLFLI